MFCLICQRKRRSLCAQIRGGILPIHIETGRYGGLEEESQICPMCDLKETENEYHFVFHCSFYCTIRDRLFNINTESDLFNMGDLQRLNWLFEKETFKLANYLEQAWDLRKGILYQ